MQFFSQNNNLTKADVKYLEHLEMEESREVGNFDLSENKQDSSCSHLPEHQRATVDEFFEDVKLITGFLGYNIFEKIEKKKESKIFYCARGGINAEGFYQDGGFVILSGSKIVKGVFSSSTSEKHTSYLDKLNNVKNNKINGHCNELEDNFLILTTDIVCKSPSQAAGICIGNSVNGWIEWKTKEGQTLDEIIRQKL